MHHTYKGAVPSFEEVVRGLSVGAGHATITAPATERVSVGLVRTKRRKAKEATDGSG